MKKTIYYISIFLAIFVVNNAVNLVIAHKFQRTYYQRQFSYKWLTNLTHKPKVILMGGSTTIWGISPTDVQKRLHLQPGEVVNLATKPNNTDITLSILKSTLNSYADNAVILYGIDPWTLSTYYYKNFALLIPRWSVQEKIKSAKEFFPFTGKYNLAFGGNVFENVFHLVYGVEDETIPRDYGGAFNADRVGKLKVRSIEEMFRFSDYHMSEYSLSRLALIDQMAYKHKIKLIVYIPTYSDSYAKEYLGAGIHPGIAGLISKEIKHGTFSSEIESLPDTNFVDDVHISAAGRHLYLERIQSLIQSNLN